MNVPLIDFTRNTPVAPQRKRSFQSRNMRKQRKLITESRSMMARITHSRRTEVIQHLTRRQGVYVTEIATLTGLTLKQCYAIVRELMVFGELETLPPTTRSSARPVRIRHFDFQNYLSASVQDTAASA